MEFYQIVIMLLSIIGYFIPTIIAALRNHNNILPIVLLNIFMGWTGAVWFGCLIWSVINSNPSTGEHA